MNKDEVRIAHTLFQLQIYKSNGQAYENLVCEVLELQNPNFERVRAYGKFGDRKNDGFDKSTGWYCQIYAPEDLSQRGGAPLVKLNEDFQGLLDFWQPICPVKIYNFVLNDKYQGAPPQVHEALAELEKQHGVSCRTMLNKDIENIFGALTEERMVMIVGGIPNPNNLSNLDYGNLNQVIRHLMTNQGKKVLSIPPENPDFIKKIRINDLSDYCATLLKVGNYQNGDVEEYFAHKSIHTKIDIRERFVQLYQEGIGLLPDSPNKGDQIFLHILQSAKPQPERMFDEPVIALMAYYFERCDIFEPPT